ncbi:MAG TPA: menaquinone biosynthesis protein [Tepidisphaeraceae bacterium]|nr:menaquinone biosynthesis protein [Tepidisphaeraceae bacterium]
MNVRLENPTSTSTSIQTLRIASVSYLNAKPLIHGLETQKDLSLILDVPSKLLPSLRDKRFDIALLPVIDYQREGGLSIVPSGGIGCDGPTLTVRIFSRVPIGRIKTLACDTDSHTSVALARIILAEEFGIHPQLIDLLKGDDRPAEARLLIGDKVVCEEPPGFEYQLDLGSAWKQLTGLPFVFAVWTARDGIDLRDLPQRLEMAKLSGLSHVRDIVTQYALPRGWPAGIAHQYLTSYLKFDITPIHLQAIEKFHHLAHHHQILERPPRPLRLYTPQ